MKLVRKNQIKEGKFYLFYRSCESCSGYLLLIEGLDDNRFKDHGYVRSTFTLKPENSTNNIVDMYNTCILYELDDEEFNTHIVIDNL